MTWLLLTALCRHKEHVARAEKDFRDAHTLRDFLHCILTDVICFNTSNKQKLTTSEAGHFICRPLHSLQSSLVEATVDHSWAYCAILVSGENINLSIYPIRESSKYVKVFFLLSASLYIFLPSHKYNFSPLVMPISLDLNVCLVDCLSKCFAQN